MTTDLDRAVIDAARAWRNALIPSTSTAPWPETRALVAAVDRLDCPHPRDRRVFFASGWRECGQCGASLPVEEPTPIPEDAT